MNIESFAPPVYYTDIIGLTNNPSLISNSLINKHTHSKESDTNTQRGRPPEGQSFE